MPDRPLRPFRVSEKGIATKERGADFLSPYNAVCLAWLAGALQRLRSEGKTKAVGYLEAVLEEVVFEMKGTHLL